MYLFEGTQTSCHISYYNGIEKEYLVTYTFYSKDHRNMPKPFETDVFTFITNKGSVVNFPGKIEESKWFNDKEGYQVVEIFMTTSVKNIDELFKKGKFKFMTTSCKEYKDYL